MLTSKERKPLSVLIAMDAAKLHPHSEHDEPDGDEGDAEPDPRHEDEDMLQACQDEIDAYRKGDAQALNAAKIAWCKLYASKEPDEEKGEGEYGGSGEGGEEES